MVLIRRQPVYFIGCIVLLSWIVACATDRAVMDVLTDPNQDLRSRPCGVPVRPLVAQGLQADSVQLILGIANQAIEAKKWKQLYTDSTQYCREIYDQHDHFIVLYLRLENGEIAHQVGGDVSVVIRKEGLEAVDVVQGQ